MQRGLKEKEITRAIRDYLKLKKIFHWKNHQGLGSQKGVPDIIGILEHGRMLLIEVKTEKGKVSEAQEEFLQTARVCGALAFEARSVEDVMKMGI